MNHSQSRLARSMVRIRTLALAVLAGGALVGCGVEIVTDPMPDANVRDGGREAGADSAVDAFVRRDAFAPDAFVLLVPDAAMTDAFMPDALVPDAFMPDARRDAGPPPGFVDLRSAGAFAILAGSTVSSTGLSMVTGDIGISPGTALIGFPPATVAGTIHAGDSVAAQAITDLTTAFHDAMARSISRTTVSGNIGGQTLPPGLYTSASSLAVSSGDLTLDGGGNTSAVWIFQTGSTLDLTAGRHVFLVGGATPANVYWQVGSSATFGTNAVIAGNILADQSITLDAGARLDGRALTRIGAVTLDGALVVRPVP